MHDITFITKDGAIILLKKAIAMKVILTPESKKKSIKILTEWQSWRTKGRTSVQETIRDDHCG